MWYTAEYYSTVKKNEVWIHAITWMNLKNLMLGERSQTHTENILYNFSYTKYLE